MDPTHLTQMKYIFLLKGCNNDVLSSGKLNYSVWKLL